jgi:hypothetical protein
MAVVPVFVEYPSNYNAGSFLYYLNLFPELQCVVREHLVAVGSLQDQAALARTCWAEYKKSTVALPVSLSHAWRECKEANATPCPDRWDLFNDAFRDAYLFSRPYLFAGRGCEAAYDPGHHWPYRNRLWWRWSTARLDCIFSYEIEHGVAIWELEIWDLTGDGRHERHTATRLDALSPTAIAEWKNMGPLARS